MSFGKVVSLYGYIFKREGNELHVHLSHLHILNLEVVDLIIDGAIYSN